MVLNNRNLFLVLGNRRLKSRCTKCHAFSEGARGNLFHAFFLPYGVAGIPWHSWACRHITPISVSVITWHYPYASLSLCLFSSYKKKSHIGLRGYPKDHICKDPISNKVSSEIRRIKTSTYILGDRIQPMAGSKTINILVYLKSWCCHILDGGKK